MLEGVSAVSERVRDPHLQAAQRAYEALSGNERIVIGALATDLRGWLHERCPSSAAGRGTCLEILAAIGQALNERSTSG